MTTDVLIRLLASDARLRTHLGTRIALALLGGAVCALGLLVALTLPRRPRPADDGVTP